MQVLLTFVTALVLGAYLMSQVRKPDRYFGRLFAWIMNQGHSAMTDWGLSHVAIETHFQILDVGCGGGRTVSKLAALANNGAVFGIDYADGSIAASRSLNQKLIDAGHVFIQKASVSQLPFQDDKFDLVTAIETQYYWPDPLHDMREILRVMKPGAKLVVIAELYKGGKHDKVSWPVMWLLGSSHLSVDEHRNLFLSAGYEHIEIAEERNKGWICAIGTKAGKPLS